MIFIRNEKHSQTKKKTLVSDRISILYQRILLRNWDFNSATAQYSVFLNGKRAQFWENKETKLISNSQMCGFARKLKLTDTREKPGIWNPKDIGKSELSSAGLVHLPHSKVGIHSARA